MYFFSEEMENCAITLHENIKLGNLVEVQKVLDENPSEKHFYNSQSESAVTVALQHEQLEIYRNLISNNKRLGLHEDFTKVVEKLSEDLKKELKSIHSEFEKPNEEHLIILYSKCRLSHDYPINLRRECFTVIEKAFEDLSDIEWIDPILKVVALAVDLKITFDFNMDSVAVMVPSKSQETKGICYPRNNEIKIGALGLKNVITDSGPSEAYFDVLGVMAHELTHNAMKIVYGNKCNPFCRNDNNTREEYIKVFKKTEENPEADLRMKTVFSAYEDVYKHSELIVCVPHTLAQYSCDSKKRQKCQENSSELFDFFKEHTLKHVNDQFVGIKARSELNGRYDMLTSLTKSESFLKPHIFDFDFYDNKGIQVVVSNCPLITVNAIYDSLKDEANFELEFIFIKLQDLNDKDVLNRIKHMQSLFTEPSILIDCDERESSEISKVIQKLIDNGIEANLIFIVNECASKVGFPSNFSNVAINHSWSDLCECIQEQILDHQTIFQNKEIKLRDIISKDLMHGFKTIPENIFQQKKLQVGKALPFKHVEGFVERTFIVRTKKKSECENGMRIYNHEEEISADDLLYMTRYQYKRSVLLFDDPGNGKSTSLKMLAKKLKENLPSYWIVFMDLKEHTKVFQANDKCSSYDDWNNVSEYFCNKILRITNFEAEVFTTLFEEGKVIIVLDGVDEVCPSYKNFIMSLIRNVISNSRVQLWISTRPHCVNDIGKQIYIDDNVAIRLKPLTEQEQDRFFEEYFRLKCDDEQILAEKLLQIKKIISLVKKSFWKEDYLSNPQLMQMIAEIIENGGDINTDNLNSYKIYDEAVNILFEKCMDKGPDAKKSLVNKLKNDSTMKFYQKEAFLALLPPPSSTNIINVLFSNITTPSFEDIIRDGLVYSNGYETYFFIHRTFAEFFVAKFFYESIFLGKVDSENYLENVMRFFVEMLPTSSLEPYFSDAVKSFLDDALEFNDQEPKIMENAKKAFANNFGDFKDTCLSDPILDKNGFREQKNYDYSFLHTFIEKGYLNTFKAISVDLIGDIDIVWFQRQIGATDKTLLMTATLFQSTDFIKRFLNLLQKSLCADLYQKLFVASTFNGENVLVASLGNPDVEVFSFLVAVAKKLLPLSDFKTFLKANSKLGHNVLHQAFAFKTDLKLLFKIFEEHLTESEIKELLFVSAQGNALFFAAVWSNSKNLKTFFDIIEEKLTQEELKELVAVVDNDKCSCLMWASRNSDANIFELMFNFIDKILKSDDREKILLPENANGIQMFNLLFMNNHSNSNETFSSILRLFRRFASLQKMRNIFNENKQILRFSLATSVQDMKGDRFMLLWNYMKEVFTENESELKEILMTRNEENETIFEWAKNTFRYEELNVLVDFADKNFTESEKQELNIILGVNN